MIDPKNVIVLLDAGHGNNTPGKCSPDKSLYEWKWTRDLVKIIKQQLDMLGFDCRVLVPEDRDIPIAERCRRANNIYCNFGKDVLLVSIHCNAKGADGQWHDARGFSAYVGLNASSKSKMLAQYLWNEAIAQGLKGNRSVPAAPYIAQNLAICRDTLCPAVLTENLFQDNEEDVDLLLSEDGKEKVTATHVNAIVEFIKDYYG